VLGKGVVVGVIEGVGVVVGEAGNGVVNAGMVIVGVSVIVEIVANGAPVEEVGEDVVVTVDKDAQLDKVIAKITIIIVMDFANVLPILL
jgi:hypothetical protein